MTTLIPRLQPLPPRFNRDLIIFGSILAVYALLVIPTVNRLGIGWDEEIDLRIARGYLTTRGFLFGIPLDMTQTRLPAFSVALVYRLLGVSNLLLGRLTSIVTGGLTLLGVYVYGKEQINRTAGLLAAGLLAVNPFFLSFARLAFTESDIYIACTLIWLLIAAARMYHRMTVGSAIVAGIFLGLSISAKATALVLVPVVWIILGSGWLFRYRNQFNSHPILSIHPAMPSWITLFWVAWTAFVLVAGVLSRVAMDRGGYGYSPQLIHYSLVLTGWLISLIWAYRHRMRTANQLMLATFVILFGLLTSVIFPPDHLTNSGILRSILFRANAEISLDAGFVMELGALHILALIFKSTTMLGLGLLVSVLVAPGFRSRPEMQLPLLFAVCYFAGLLILPLGQTFYTIAILPMLSLLLSHQLLLLWSKRQFVVRLLAVFTFVWWAWEMVLCYPDYHLNGYQWLDKRVILGRSSIGYRSIVFTPADGVQQAVEWLNANAEEGQVALLYVGPFHIVRYIAPDPRYQIISAAEGDLSSRPDYVVVHINEVISQGHGRETPEDSVVQYPFDLEDLNRGYEKIYDVRRAFNLEVVSIWRRR